MQKKKKNPTKTHLFTLVVDLFVGALPLPENPHVEVA